MGTLYLKVLAGLIALTLASACSRSRQRQPADDGLDAGADAATDAMIDTPADAAAPRDAAELDLPADASAREVVLAFEQLLVKSCECEAVSPCVGAWTEQFDDVNMDCVADAIEQAGISACVASRLRELATCWYGADCRSCPSAELTEDTPLADLVEVSCAGEQARAYRDALRAAASCTP